MKHAGITVIVLVAVVLVSLLIYTCSYQVDGTRDICMVTTFGKITDVVDGKADPGLHFKWPWPVQGLYRYDFREQVLETALDQFTIAEQYNITAKFFCTWRIKNAVVFHKSKTKGRSTEEIEDAIRSQLTSDMKSVMGTRSMSELVNVDPERMKLEGIEQEVAARLDKAVGDDYGIEITSLGIHFLNLPQSVTKTVIDSMIKDREKEAERYRSEGKAVADAIRGRAEAARDKILALARTRAADIVARGEEVAAKWYLQFREDPDFAVFLRSVEALRAALRERAVFVLDSSVMPILRRFWKSPGEMDRSK